MSARFQRITPFLWFDDQAEAAAKFYVSVFEHSRIVSVTHFTAESAAASGRPDGSVMTVDFELDGQSLTALNGGPLFQFNEAISLVVHCRTQDEVDYYWNKLTQGGNKRSQQCGWLKDRYGLSWQVVPDEMIRMLADPDAGRVARVTAAIMQMKKLDLDVLKRAAAG